MTDQFPNSLAEPAHHLGQRQDHLHGRVSLHSHCLELLHSSLRFNLVWFLQGDSPFLVKENLLQPIKAGAESRYFLRSTGHSQGIECNTTVCRTMQMEHL